ncbi:hypothetical protein NO365_01023 [Planktothrix agardhii]|nr:hypothetical protein NO365_01023 [Planktothrix agardhii]
MPEVGQIFQNLRKILDSVKTLQSTLQFPGAMID